MGVDTQAVKPRRRNVTYGKSSRKALSGVQRPTNNFLSASEDEIDRQGLLQTRKYASPATITIAKRQASGSQKHHILNKRSASTSLSDKVSLVDDDLSDVPETQISQTAPSTSSGAKRDFLPARRLPTEKRRRLHKEDQGHNELNLNRIGSRPNSTAEARGLRLAHGSESQRDGSWVPSQRIASKASAQPGTVKPSNRIANNIGAHRGETQKSSIGPPGQEEITPSAASGTQSSPKQPFCFDGAGTESLKARTRSPEKGHGDDLPRFASPSSLQMPDLTISTLRRARSKTPTNNPPNNYNFGHATTFSPSRQKLREKLINNSQYSSTPPEQDVDDTCMKASTPPSLISDESLAENMKYVADNPSTAEERNGSEVIGSAPISQNRGPKVTYTAGHRTLLQESADTIFESSILIDRTLVVPKKSRELPTPVKPTKILSDEEELEKPSQNSMRSIYELREAGVNQRLTRQTEALLDDVEISAHLSQRRLALIELVKGLQTPSFVRQFLEAGCEIRLLDIARSCSDEIIGFLISIIFLVTANEPDSHTMLEDRFQSKTVNVLSQYLEYNDCMEGAFLSRRFGTSRDFQRQIRTICEYIKKLPVWGTARPQKLTCQVVSLQCLEHIVRSSREGGSVQELLSKESIERLVDIVYHADVGSEPGEATPQDCVITTTLALSILESSAIVYSISGQDCSLLWTDRTVTRLGEFVLKVSSNKAEDWQLLSLFLRLGLNLSNNSLQICRVLSRTDIIRTILQITANNFSLLSADGSVNNHNVLMDNLILSLGLLINLCDNYPKTCKLFLEPAGDGGAPLETVIRLFLTRIPSAFEVSLPPSSIRTY